MVCHKDSTFVFSLYTVNIDIVLIPICYFADLLIVIGILYRSVQCKAILHVYTVIRHIGEISLKLAVGSKRIGYFQTVCSAFWHHHIGIAVLQVNSVRCTANHGLKISLISKNVTGTDTCCPNTGFTMPSIAMVNIRSICNRSAYIAIGDIGATGSNQAAHTAVNIIIFIIRNIYNQIINRGAPFNIHRGRANQASQVATTPSGNRLVIVPQFIA